MRASVFFFSQTIVVLGRDGVYVYTRILVYSLRVTLRILRETRGDESPRLIPSQTIGLFLNERTVYLRVVFAHRELATRGNRYAVTLCRERTSRYSLARLTSVKTTTHAEI